VSFRKILVEPQGNCETVVAGRLEGPVDPGKLAFEI
jgi:hypothetical protein